MCMTVHIRGIPEGSNHTHTHQTHTHAQIHTHASTHTHSHTNICLRRSPILHGSHDICCHIESYSSDGEARMPLSTIYPEQNNNAKQCRDGTTVRLGFVYLVSLTEVQTSFPLFNAFPQLTHLSAHLHTHCLLSSSNSLFIRFLPFSLFTPSILEDFPITLFLPSSVLGSSDVIASTPVSSNSRLSGVHRRLLLPTMQFSS